MFNESYSKSDILLKKHKNIKLSSTTLFLCLRLDDSKFQRIFIVYIVLYCIIVIIFIYKSVYSKINLDDSTILINFLNNKYS